MEKCALFFKKIKAVKVSYRFFSFVFKNIQNGAELGGAIFEYENEYEYQGIRRILLKLNQPDPT